MQGAPAVLVSLAEYHGPAHSSKFGRLENIETWYCSRIDVPYLQYNGTFFGVAFAQVLRELQNQ